MRIPNRFLSLLLWLPCTFAAANPLFTAADPHAVVIDDRTWIYPTGGGRHTEFFAWSSTDLQKWEKSGLIFQLADAKWVDDDGAPHHAAWAPAVIRANGKFYLYFSVGPQNPTPSRIGVAVGVTPQGPFKDSGKPLLTGGKGFEAIDPFVFHDPATRKYHLYAGGSAGTKLRVFELANDLISIGKEIPMETPRFFTEGVWLHVSGGLYYLSYSHGSYRDQTYSVHYATGPGALGPWTYQGVILASDGSHKGPGHHSILQEPGPRKWKIIYHRWNQRRGPGPYSGQRETCIDDLIHGADGRIQTVLMTPGGQ